MVAMQRARPWLPWIVWGVAAVAYAVAVINRSSLAALGPEAQHHFGIDATTLSLFPVLQLVVYAGMQLPVGMLLNRVGASAMVISGGLLMVLGQVIMATTGEVWLAVAARVLVGAGDACIFISVMKMLPEWFAVRQLPTVSQFTGLIGQAGQLISVTPLAAIVGLAGWRAGFLGLAGAGLFVTIVAVCVLRDAPGQATLLERMTRHSGRITKNARSLSEQGGAAVATVAPPATESIPLVRTPRGLGFFGQIARMLRVPGIRLGYWLHFTSQFSSNVFLLLWGTPFLIGGIGLSASQSGGLLSLTVISSMAAGLVLGPISSRFMRRRVWVNFGITALIATVWLAVLLTPGTPPMWLLVALVLIIPLGGPASMISFEVVRSHSPKSYQAFSTGIVNTGGFTAALLVMLLLGFVLDIQGAGSPDQYSLTAFKWAFAVQVPFWALGLTMIVREQRKTKQWMTERGRRLR